MKKIIYCLPFLFLLACKKDKTTAPATNSTNTGSATGFYAVFITGEEMTYNNDTLYVNPHDCYAEFYSSPITDTTTVMNPVEMDSLTLNGVRLKYDYGMYYDSTYAIQFSPSTWVVGGANGIPSFTYTNNDPIPSFSGYAAWPDTIHINQNTVIPMTGVAGAQDVEVTLNVNGVGLNQTIFLNASSVTFSASSMSNLNVNSYATLSVNLTRTNTQTIGGKQMVFYNTYNLSKHVVLQ